MIKLFSGQKIRNKLIAINMLTTSIALLIASISILTYTQLTTRESMANDMSIIAKLISNRVSTAITFNDLDFAYEQLETLQIKPHIILSCIYANKNAARLFTYWSRDNQSSSLCPSNIDYFTPRIENNFFEVHVAILSDEQTVGSIYIRSDLGKFSQQFSQLLYVLIGVILFVSLLAYKISAYLQRLISEPIQHLHQTSISISKNKDYSIRAEKETHDELGALVDSFNKMLSTIEQQNTDLLESKDNLNELIMALQESEEHFRAIFEQAGDSIVLVNIYDGKFHEYNKIAHQTLGYNREEFSRLQLQDIEYFQGSTTDTENYHISSAVIPESFESQLLCKDGDVLDVLISAKDIIVRKKSYRVLIIRNITEQKRIDREIIALNSRMHAVLDSATQVSIIAIDMNGLITVFNRGAEILLGYKQDDILNKELLPIFHLESELEIHQKMVEDEFKIKPSKLQALTERVRRSGFEIGFWHYLSADGEQIPVQLTVTRIRDNNNELQGYLCIANDLREKVLEEKRHAALESQLQQSQKMETIGTLAGGIAHDLNNLLTPIVGYTEMVMEDCEEESKEYRRLSRVIKAAIRARDLVKQILTFSHQVEHQSKAINVKNIVKEVIDLLSSSLPPSIELKAKIDEDNLYIQADATKIHQVLMNLCTNSAHAMADQSGKLTITVCKNYIDTDQKAILHLDEGEYVKISVSDTGCGMTEKTKSRIFEPFFTTKEIGEGTGLGLSVAHGIIHSHNGNIQVFSTADEGTTFDIYLPMVGVPTHKKNSIKLTTIEAKSAHVLYVDDEPSITKMARKMLNRKGYRITSVTSSPKALELFKRSPDNFDILVSDQTMPGMKGTELAKKIHQIKPELPIILVTGLGSILKKESLSDFGILDVVSKPVLSDDLSDAINRALRSK